MISESTTATTGRRDPSALRAVDCDLHHQFTSWDEVVPFVPAGFRHRVAKSGGPALARHGYRRVGARDDVAPRPEGGRPNTDPSFVRAVLRERGVDVAILTGNQFSLGVQPNMDFPAAIARALNDWTLEKWVRPNDCFKGSILIAQQDPEQAALEIDRIGDDPGMVQVLMCSAGESPFGRRTYHPIYAACERHGLPLALHIGGEGAGISSPPTSVGYPNTYLEWYGSLPQSYMAHVMSMVTEGVFEKFPGLKVVMCEGGLAWLPHIVWRFDKNFKAQRAETPWVTRLPSEYIYEHFRLTTYPLEELPNPDDLPRVLELVQAEKTVLFSTNFPNWEYGDPLEMLASVPERYRRRIMVENALEVYGERLLAPNL
jgi:uncharacterized protein